MKMKSSALLVMAGVGGTLLYQNIKNGNLKRMVNKMMKKESLAIDKLEDMM